MRIALDKIGKRFQFSWVFRNLVHSFESGQRVAITGPNGSGKSTLLKIVSGQLVPSEGRVEYFLNEKILDEDKVYRTISFSAPYVDLIEEYNLKEMLNFHFQFNQRNKDVDLQNMVEILGLKDSMNKSLLYYSSGMKQRVRHLLVFGSDNPVWIFDEPSTNLDEQGINWFESTLNSLGSNRLVLIGTNQEREKNWCESELKVSNFKNNKLSPDGKNKIQNP